ncbi:uncharacterized protein LOC126981880 isoform X4 [Eriocheir sinensis]|uniref:uncharacterized protein LOC126981880 isoform X4 n=1 Tax=Eriocheir sinensis TaxID=95602 RepID=UPI0021C906B8|nr:uncharacterized protein LOC126981880 isoform X4 [Eriocheir sinensis]
MAGSGQQMANVNFSRYSSAVFKVAQQEVWRVFDWLYHHHHRHQPPVYVGQRVRECEGVKRRGIGAMERAALERQDDPATMDITLLYQLLQLTCGLRPDGPDWTSPGEVGQQPSLEHRLYLIKQKRNKLSHCADQYMHMSDGRLDTLLQELSGLLCHSLRQAGQRSARPAEEVEAAVASVKDRLAHIQASVPASAMLPQEFALLARTELQDLWEQSGSRAQRLSPPLLRWTLGAHAVALDQLLQGPGGEEGQPPKVLAVVGETGIGKSSLCWQLAEAWLQGEAAAAAAEVVVVVECRQVFTRDLTRLLLVDLLPQTCRRCHPEEVLGLLGALRVLWLLDGFEEASGDARDLLRRLVELCSGSSGGHVVVVTCQPHYREELDACLAPAVTPCYATHCGLTKQGFHTLLATLLQDGQEAAGEATEGRVEAGEDRGKEPKGESSGGGEEAGGEGKVTQGEREGSGKKVGVEAQCEAFLQEVQKLDPRLLGELHNPLKLVLAVHLWKEGRLGEAAGAPLTRLYAAIQEVLVAKLVARARAGSRLTEAEVRERVRQWVAALCREALAMRGRGCFVALDETAERLLRERAIQLMLPYTDCFSVFLVCRSGPGPKHSFLHHTQQSVLAAQHLHTLLLQDLTAQELRALLLPGPPTTSTTDTTNTTTPTTNTTDTNFSTTTTPTTTATLTDSLVAFKISVSALKDSAAALKDSAAALTTTTDTTAIARFISSTTALKDSLAAVKGSLFADITPTIDSILTTTTATLTNSRVAITNSCFAVININGILKHATDVLNDSAAALEDSVGALKDYPASVSPLTAIAHFQAMANFKASVGAFKDLNAALITTNNNTIDKLNNLYVLLIPDFLDILVEAAASLAAAGSLSEGRAKVLAELLEQCRHCPWLKVVRRTACCPTMAREVRPRLTEEWKVTDAHVQASAVLADIRAPACITIELHDKSDNLPHLLPLLHCLAKAHVRVHLHGIFSLCVPLPSPCDSLLLPLCGSASLCSLISFTGRLSTKGYRALWQQRSNLVSMKVLVPDPTSLEELIQLTHHTKCLQEVRIIFLSIFRALPSKSVSPRVGVHLLLMCVEDKEAEDAVILARRIKRTFKSIRLVQVSPSTVCRMVEVFMKKKVRTPSLGRVAMFQIIDILQTISFHFFPLPLPPNMTLEHVYEMWDNLHMKVTMRVETPSTDTGTAADTEDSCSGAESGDVAGP